MNVFAGAAVAVVGGAIPGALLAKGINEQSNGQNGKPEIAGAVMSMFPVCIGVGLTAGNFPVSVAALGAGIVGGMIGTGLLLD